MWRSVGILGCTIFLIAFSANAGLLGPSDFDECILDNMKGVNSDAAAKLIARSCAKKFPKTKPGNFDEKFGDRGVLRGHVYAKNGRGDVLRMEGARVRLLNADVLPSLKQHLAARDTLYDKAVTDAMEEIRGEVLNKLPQKSTELHSQIQSLTDDIARTKRDDEVLAREITDLKKAAQAADAAETVAATARQVDKKTATHRDAARTKELEAEALRVAGEIDQKKSEYADAQTDSDETFEAEKAKLTERLEARQKAETAMKKKFSLGRKAMANKADTRIEQAATKISKLKAELSRARDDLNTARRKKAASLRDAYVRKEIPLKSYYGKEYGTFGDVVPCFKVTNNGTLAIRQLVVGVKFQGRSTTSFGLNANSIMKLRITDVHVVGHNWQFDSPMTPALQNKYGEEVQGIGPGQSWPKRGCVSIYKFNVKGDVQRALEKVGGFSSSGWSFYIKRIDLARADSLNAIKTNYDSTKVWSFTSSSTINLFRKQVDAAEKKMEPKQRIRTLMTALAQAERAYPDARARKSKELGAYDKDNRPLLAQLADQRKNAAAALAALKRPMVGDSILTDLQARTAAIADEIATISKNAKMRQTDLATAADQAHAAADDRKIALTAKQRERTSTRDAVAAQEKELATARQELKALEERAESFEKRFGPAYNETHKDLRKELTKYGTGGDEAWLSALDELLLAAKGHDARVDLKGAYRFNNLALGPYLVYTTYTHRRTSIMWLQAVDVGRDTNLEMGSFNGLIKPERNIDAVAALLSKALAARP